MTRRTRNPAIAVVGAGRWGRNHIQTLHELGFLAGIVEMNAGVRAEFNKKYPSIRIFERIEDAIKEDFDGFVVATPAETHFDVARYIINHKKHLLVEKPLTLKVKEAVILKELAKKNNVNLIVGHLLLFHPAMRKIKELIDGGKIGKLQYLYSNRLNLGAVRTEENILWSFAPHDISVFQYFIGQSPTEVVSRGGAFLQPHIHDSSMTILTYPDNIIGHIFVNWLHPFKEHRLVIVGSKGMLSYEDSSEGRHILFYEKGIDWVRGEPIKRDGPTENIPYQKIKPLTEELKYFAKHLSGDAVTIADAQSGVEVLEILEKASESLMRGATADMKNKSTETDHSLIHPTVVIDEGAVVGPGTKIWHFSHVLSGSQIGKGCNIGQNVVIGPRVTIGNGCKIQNNVSIYEGITLEDGVFCGPSCVLTNVLNPRCEIPRMKELRQTLIRRGATIGANATVVCGHIVGRYAFIGAGAVVTKDIADYALVYGNPAQVKGWICECGVKLELIKNKSVCASCGKKYALSKHVLIRTS